MAVVPYFCAETSWVSLHSEHAVVTSEVLRFNAPVYRQGDVGLIRTFGGMAGFGWLKHGLNMSRGNLLAIQGGALMLEMVFFAWIMLIGYVGRSLLGPEAEGSTATWLHALAFSVLIYAVFGALCVGYLRVVDAVDRGKPVSLADSFSGFRDPKLLLRLGAFVAVAGVLREAASLATTYLFDPDLVGQHLQLLQGLTGPLEDSLALRKKLTSPMSIESVIVRSMLGAFSFCVLALAVGQVILGKRGLWRAMADSFAGTCLNVLPLLALLLGYAALMALSLVLVEPLSYAVKVGVITSPAVPLTLLVVTGHASMVAAVGVMHRMWRDICDERVTEADATLAGPAGVTSEVATETSAT